GGDPAAGFQHRHLLAVLEAGGGGVDQDFAADALKRGRIDGGERCVVDCGDCVLDGYGRGADRRASAVRGNVDSGGIADRAGAVVDQVRGECGGGAVIVHRRHEADQGGGAQNEGVGGVGGGDRGPLAAVMILPFALGGGGGIAGDRDAGEAVAVHIGEGGAEDCGDALAGGGEDVLVHGCENGRVAARHLRVVDGSDSHSERDGVRGVGHAAASAGIADRDGGDSLGRQVAVVDEAGDELGRVAAIIGGGDEAEADVGGEVERLVVAQGADRGPQGAVVVLPLAFGGQGGRIAGEDDSAECGIDVGEVAAEEIVDGVAERSGRVLGDVGKERLVDVHNRRTVVLGRDDDGD